MLIVDISIELLVRSKNMNRNSAIKALMLIGEELAEKYGYTEMFVCRGSNESTCGEGLVNVLEKKYGDCSTEYKWVKANDNGKEESIHFRFRFSSPCISIRQPGEVFCELQLSDYDYNTKIHTGNFDINEIVTWKREGLKLQKLLVDMWDEKKRGENE